MGGRCNDPVKNQPRGVYYPNVPNLRWLWLDFTDPRFDLTSEQKREVRRRARRIRFFDQPVFISGMPLTNEIREAKLRRRSAWARFISRSPLVLVYFAWLAFSLFLPFALRHGPPLVVAGVVAISAMVMWIITCWIGSMLARPWYRYAMYELGYEICAECGYPLFGLDDSTHCPECGWRKTHRDDPPPVDWTEADRQTLRRHGYEPCRMCRGLLRTDDTACPHCGAAHDATTSRT